MSHSITEHRSSYVEGYLTIMSRWSSILAIRRPNSLSDPEMPTSSSVCEVPIHSKLNLKRLLDSVRWARDRSARTQHTRAIRVVGLHVQCTRHQTWPSVTQHII